jgi:pimeloyl-ACP methyl ester carboxylesterase
VFGVYHPPLARRSPERSVVLCYPLVQEYQRCHWAFRKLATLLAKAGLHVLRFDYHGTGDSAGDGSEARLAQWIADIRTAVAEIGDLSGVRRPSLVGLRLGASLALLATRDGPEIRDMVLWEPVANGRNHLRELKEIERVKFSQLPHPPSPGPGELLECALPPALRQEIEGVDLSEPSSFRADRLLLFAGARRFDHETITANLTDRSRRPPSVFIVQEDAEDRHDGVLLSTKVLLAITTELSGEGR